ncbi:MAG: hypothetical protein HC834_02815 [Rhodospirillales bacterium]|nr:hypothetical protein [Rhodospirillales bacterium]
MMTVYHTNITPLEKNGVALKPLDLVVVDQIPEHFWADPEFRQLKDYAGSYGLVTYYGAGTGPSCSPWYFDRKGHPGWVMADGSAVNVLCRGDNGDSYQNVERVVGNCPTLSQKWSYRHAATAVIRVASYHA